MTQSSTSPDCTVTLGIVELGSNSFGIFPYTVMKKSIGLFGSFRFLGVSEKNKTRRCFGCTWLSGSRTLVVLVFAVAAAIFACGSGAAGLATMVARGLVGSFSPAGPVFTVRVT